MTDIQNTIFIYMDDVRDAPSDQWIVLRNAEITYAFIVEFAKEGYQMVVSLDHDLGENKRTGYDLLNWLEKDIVTDENFRPNICFQIHSANPVGRANMERAIGAIMRLV